MKTCEVMAARNYFDDVGNSQSRTCKECEKKTFLILQMKTHIRDNDAEY